MDPPPTPKMNCPASHNILEKSSTIQLFVILCINPNGMWTLYACNLPMVLAKKLYLLYNQDSYNPVMGPAYQPAHQGCIY
ncbi:hypothetical protein DSO57_1034467 [Entomophthora muscae]|uniref:Uncharacterized protein n=1 Tax=Entomophthora muscae TaxID=34485 RepID=A0ACC2UL55_9FUNG|nr:hypothetical protein DSO57_1034467 [Entomophthora muscae]